MEVKEDYYGRWDDYCVGCLCSACSISTRRASRRKLAVIGGYMDLLAFVAGFVIGFLLRRILWKVS